MDMCTTGIPYRNSRLDITFLEQCRRAVCHFVNKKKNVEEEEEEEGV
jgi:hypothetical protein